MGRDIENLPFHKREFEALFHNLSIQRKAFKLKSRLGECGCSVDDLDMLKSTLVNYENKLYELKRENEAIKNEIVINITR